MNLTYFRPKMRGNMENKNNNPVNIRFVQNVRHQKFICEHHIWCHVKISEVATPVSMIPKFWWSLEVAAAGLHLCFVTKGNEWRKRTFPMVTIRRGFTIRLKRLKPRIPDFGGPQNLGSKNNFQHFCKQYIFVALFWFIAHVLLCR